MAAHPAVIASACARGLHAARRAGAAQDRHARDYSPLQSTAASINCDVRAAHCRRRQAAATMRHRRSRPQSGFLEGAP